MRLHCCSRNGSKKKRRKKKGYERGCDGVSNELIEEMGGKGKKKGGGRGEVVWQIREQEEKD
jgi:hypothetical protein